MFANTFAVLFNASITTINDDNYSRYIVYIFRDIASDIWKIRRDGYHTVVNINECAGNLIMKVYYTRVGERRRMFGEISRTGKDRLNVKGGGNERIGIWAELVVEYYRLNGNQESR